MITSITQAVLMVVVGMKLAAAATGAELRERDVPLRVRTQAKIKQMEASAHRKTNGNP